MLLMLLLLLLFVFLLLVERHLDRFEEDGHEQVLLEDRAKFSPAGRTGIFLVARHGSGIVTMIGVFGSVGMGGQEPDHAVFVVDVLAGGWIVGPDDRLSDTKVLEAYDAGSGEFRRRNIVVLCGGNNRCGGCIGTGFGAVKGSCSGCFAGIKRGYSGICIPCII